MSTRDGEVVKLFDSNRDGYADVDEAAAAIEFAVYFKQKAEQPRNRELAAMSENDRAWYLANEWLVKQCQ